MNFLESEEIGELADILEVIDAIAGFKQFDETVLQSVKKRKKQKSAANFRKELFLRSPKEN
jgi:predicted house-cleaning noncanonical NTP pyrophosphatase (MazG superfamily)